MTLAALNGKEAVDAPREHWSHSRISKYLQCPEQYRLHYLEGLRTRVPSANLVFGQVIHRALAVLFQADADPIGFFRESWENLKGTEMTFSYRDSWERLAEIGERLMAEFVASELPRFGTVTAVEHSFTLSITNLALPFVGIIDLVAEVDGTKTVLDFKTAAAAYGDHEVILNDQLTAYGLAEPDAEQSALCVLVKTKEPRIDWHFSRRGSEDLAEYLAKVATVAHAVSLGHFYKRPGKWCSYCDFLPICVGNHTKAQETLVRVAPGS